MPVATFRNFYFDNNTTQRDFMLDIMTTIRIFRDAELSRARKVEPSIFVLSLYPVSYNSKHSELKIDGTDLLCLE